MVEADYVENTVHTTTILSEDENLSEQNGINKTIGTFSNPITTYTCQTCATDECTRAVRPLFLSKSSIKACFPSLPGGGHNLRLRPKFLRPTYVDEDCSPGLNEDEENGENRSQIQYITNAIIHSTNLIHLSRAFRPDFSFNCVTIKAWLVNIVTGRRKKVRVLLDDASNVTIMLRRTAERLGLCSGEDVSTGFTSTGSALHHYEAEKEVRFRLESLAGSYTNGVFTPKYATGEIQGCTLPNVSSGFRPVDINPDDYDHLCEVDDWTETYPTPAKVAKRAEVDVLLGTPYVYRIQSAVPSVGRAPDDPIGIHTYLGSAISAPSWEGETDICHTMMEESGTMPIVHNTVTGDPTPIDLTRLFSLDVLGIECPTEEVSKLSAAEQEAVDMIEASITYGPTLKQYCTGLPWKGGQKIERTNEAAAKRLAIRFARRLEKDSVLAEGWTQSYADAEAKGFCRPLTKDELKQTEGFHYIQTFCVKQPKPTHPFRLVFGANQKVGCQEDGAIKAKSLNDFLHIGPNYLRELAQLVIRV